MVGFISSIMILVVYDIHYQVRYGEALCLAVLTSSRARQACSGSCIFARRKATRSSRRLQGHSPLRHCFGRAGCQSHGPCSMGHVLGLEQYWGVSTQRARFYASRALLSLTDKNLRAFDGKAKVWSIDQRTCVATHTEIDRTLWAVKWLPKTGKNEGFAVAGANKSISFYREATGG